jgi:hypothetical protein
VATWPDRLNIAVGYDSYNTIQYKNFNLIFSMTCLYSNDLQISSLESIETLEMRFNEAEKVTQ